MSAEAMRKHGGTVGDHTGKEDTTYLEAGSALAREHAAHVTGDNNTNQEVIASKPPVGKKGARGVQGGSD
jgi:hypothetical protein